MEEEKQKGEEIISLSMFAEVPVTEFIAGLQRGLIKTKAKKLEMTV